MNKLIVNYLEIMVLNEKYNPAIPAKANPTSAMFLICFFKFSI